MTFEVVKQRLDSVRAAVRDAQPRTILLVAWIILLVYAFPGYMNFDVGEQLYEMRRGNVTDFHPPMMGGYWRVAELFVTGPFPLLLLQSSLFLWGMYTLLGMRLERRTSAWVAAALLLFPPLLTPMGMIWKDAQMSAFLIAGAALVLKASWRARVTGIVLFVAAAGVRFNGAAALPFLCLAATFTWMTGRRVVAFAAAVVLTLAIIIAASLINRALTDTPAYNWYRTTAVIDIVGTTCFAPPLSDEEVLKILDGITLYEKTNIQKLFCDRYPAGKGANGAPPWYQYSELFDWHPDKDDRLARKRAWKTLVTRYPGAYLRHRMTLASDMLGVGRVRLWEPVGQDFAANEEHLRRIHHDHLHSWFQRSVGDACRWLAAHTVLYRVYLYALLALVFFGWGVWKRDGLVIALTGSGLLYELSVAVGANAPDFRYSHFLLSCTCIAAVWITAARWRAGRPTG